MEEDLIHIPAVPRYELTQRQNTDYYILYILRSSVNQSAWLKLLYPHVSNPRPTGRIQPAIKLYVARSFHLHCTKLHQCEIIFSII